MKKGSYLDLLILTGLTLLLGSLFYLNPLWTRNFYTNHIFSFWRRFFGNLHTWQILLIWGLLIITFFRIHSRREHIQTSIGRMLLKWISPLLLLTILFYWLWGFNYLATKPEDIIHIPSNHIPKEDLLAAFQNQTILINNLRATLSIHKWQSITKDSLLHAETKNWTNAVKAVLEPLGYNTNHTTKVVTAWPGGGLLRIGTAGFYNFFRASPTVDTALHCIQIPNVSMHELAHAYGISDEGSANFIAYLAGLKSSDTLTKYSSELSFWRSLSYATFMADSLQSKVIRNQLSPAVRFDIADIRRTMDLYPDIAPQLRDEIYNLFLKSQGVSEGMESYGRYLSLVLNWKRNKTN